MGVRTLADGLEFPEGPVALADGSVILVEIAAGAVTRVSPNGSKTIVARPGGGPNNGIGLSPDEKTLYVAETGPARLRTFDIVEPGIVRKHR